VIRRDEEVADEGEEVALAKALSKLFLAIGDDLAERELSRTGGWMDLIGVEALVGVSCWCLELIEEDETDEGELEDDEL